MEIILSVTELWKSLRERNFIANGIAEVQYEVECSIFVEITFFILTRIALS